MAVADLRGVHADQAQFAPIAKLDRVAVVYTTDAHLFISTVKSAAFTVRRQRRGGADQDKKEAVQDDARLLEGVEDYFFRPYFWRNLSTRPPLSAVFCLPV